MWGEKEPKASLLYQCRKTFIFTGISGPILFPGKNFSFPFPTPSHILATLSSPCLGYPRMFPLQGPDGSEGIYALVRGEAVVPRRHHVVMFEMTACCQKSEALLEGMGHLLWAAGLSSSGKAARRGGVHLAWRRADMHVGSAPCGDST